jgi:hypothetical protein
MENFSAPSSIDLFHLLIQLTIEPRIKIHLLTLLKTRKGVECKHLLLFYYLFKLNSSYN